MLNLNDYNYIVNEDYIGNEINPINQKNIYELAHSYFNSNIMSIIEENEKINLLIVDPQRDFIDINKGALPVNGAIEDIKRITKFIYSNINKISNIYVTLDTHKYDSIFHSIMWKDSNNDFVKPFTEITLEKIENNEIIPIYNKDIQIDYVRQLKNQGSNNLMI